MNAQTNTRPENRQDDTHSRWILVLWSFLSLCIILPLSMHSQEMWLGGLVVTCGLFLAGLAYYRRQTRIERVVTEYLSKFRSGNYTNGLDTLLKCGANELENRFELYEVCRKILKREKKAQDPLGVSDLPRRDVFAFIKWCHKNNEDISSGSDTMVLIAQFRGDLPKEKL